MIEVTGDLWTYPADVRVITTNGTVKKNGEAVMGRGCAAEAKKKWPFIAATLGRAITKHGNTVQCLDRFPQEWRTNPDGSREVVKSCMIYTFPVKHNWYERADIDLIIQSAEVLSMCVSDGFEDQAITVVLPRPGCGNGNLKWEDVKPVLEPILDDRFHVITWR